jgi:DUF4097 and DUF4098 domain-containing protein YvlB
MRRLHSFVYIFAIVTVAISGGVSQVSAAEWKVLDDSRWCRSDRWEHQRFCEVREITLPADRDVIEVDGMANGGISVEGWDRNEIRIRARVTVWDRDDEDAREIADRIVIETDGESIRAEGPQSRHRSGWSVTYRIMVPRKSNLDLVANNGGISVAEVEGDIRLDATNGGLSLSRLAGYVKGRTTNGGVDVELDGKSWNGKGLDVRSTNGGVSLAIPDNYSAELETGTVNGGIEIEFPITVQGRIDKSLRATLGEGGAPVVVRTTNGGVHISRF